VAVGGKGDAAAAVATLTLLPTPSVRLATWTFNSDPPDADPLTGLDTAGSSDAPSSFSLQSATLPGGPYATVSASITQLGPGLFRAERPVAGAQQFYRIQRN
jgi:hypothetical protein